MSAERFALDTNILVYTVDRDAGERSERARQIVRHAKGRPCVLAAQNVGEFFAAVTRKRLVDRPTAAARSRDWMTMFEIVPAPVGAVQWHWPRQRPDASPTGMPCCSPRWAWPEPVARPLGI